MIYGDLKPYFRGRRKPVEIFEEENNVIRLVFQSRPIDMERKLLWESRQTK